METGSAIRSITTNTDNYFINDYTKAADIITQFMKINLFTLGVLAIILSVRSVWQIVKKNAAFVAAEVKSDFLLAVLRKNSLRILFNLILCLVLLFVIIVLYRLIVFDLYIPNKYISPSRILDFGFYKRLILDNLQNKNLYYAYKSTAYERLYTFELWLNFAATGMNVALSVIFAFRAAALKLGQNILPFHIRFRH